MGVPDRRGGAGGAARGDAPARRARRSGERRAGGHAGRPAGTLLRDDLFWVRGKLLLQVGGYGPPGIPLLQSRQELVARKLDARASALR